MINSKQSTTCAHSNVLLQSGMIDIFSLCTSMIMPQPLLCRISSVLWCLVI
jgi:hypothetical protein